MSPLTNGPPVSVENTHKCYSILCNAYGSIIRARNEDQKELGHMSAQCSEIELTLVEIYIATLDYGSDTYVRSKWQL